MALLATMRELDAPHARIGAGAVRNRAWDRLHGLDGPRPDADVDVAWFDPAGLSPRRDRLLQARLAVAAPDVPWEATSQAAVHLGFEDAFGHAVPPLRSIREAVASWPEYATCVAVSRRADGTLAVIASYGLDDLPDMRVRRNPARVSLQPCRHRLATKRYRARWPRVEVVEA